MQRRCHLPNIRNLILTRPAIAALFAVVSLYLCWLGGGATRYGNYAFVEALQHNDSTAASDAFAIGHDWKVILARLDALGDPRLYGRALDAEIGYAEGNIISAYDDSAIEVVECDRWVVDRLVARGGRPSYKYLENAATEGSERLVRFLLDHGAPVRGDKGDRVLLAYAARSGDARLAQLFLERGADPNAVCAGGYLSDLGYDDIKPHWRVLYLAAKEGNTEVVRVLLAHGADPLLDEESNGQIWEAVRHLTRVEKADETDDTTAGMRRRAWKVLKAEVERRLGHPVAD